MSRLEREQRPQFKEKNELVKSLEEMGFTVQKKDVDMAGVAGVTSFTAEYSQNIGHARVLTLKLEVSEGSDVIIADVSLEDQESLRNTEPLNRDQERAYLVKVYSRYKQILSQALGRADLLQKLVESPSEKIRVVVERGTAAVDQGQEAPSQMNPVDFPEYERVNARIYKEIKKLLKDKNVRQTIVDALSSYIFEKKPDLTAIMKHYGLDTADRMAFESKSPRMKARELYDKNVSYGYPADVKLLNIIDDLVVPLDDLVLPSGDASWRLRHLYLVIAG